MSLKLSTLAVPLFALALGFPSAFAADTVSSDAMATEMDPMATECITKADAEADTMKMQAMMTDCGKMYPDAVMAHCMMKADMETDAMKHDDMAATCKVMAPDAMGTM